MAWLIRNIRLPTALASRLMGWAQGTPPVPVTAAQIAEQQADEAERSASG